MKAALYARVSRADQQTIPAQLSEMREYCARRSWQIVGEFEEQASGAKTDRPQRKELMRLVQRGKVEVVLVWKLDRWGRSTVDLLSTLKEIHGCGAAFVSITEGLDLTTPSGRMMAGMLAVFAEFEREMIIARTVEGLKLAREKGKTLGRPKVSEEKKAHILAFAKEGHKSPKISELTGIPASTVRRIVKNG